MTTQAAATESAFSAKRLSCSDSAFPRLSPELALRVIADLGFHAVDIGVLAGYPHVPPEAVVADPAGAADAARRRVERAQLGVADVFAILGDPFSALAVNHPDPAVREESRRQFDQIVQFAKPLAPPGITTLPGVPFEGIEPAASRELAAAELQFRAEIAAEAGFALSIEPHYESIAATPAETLELLEMAPGVTLTLDYSHFIFQGISQAEVDTLVPHARHLHLRPAAPGEMQAKAREGTIDWELVLARLAEAEYAGYLDLEFCCEEWMGLNNVDCLTETAELRELLLVAFARMNGEHAATAPG